MLRRTRPLRAALAAALALAVTATGCGSGEDSDATGPTDQGGETEVVKVGVLPTSGIAPLYLGRDKGFFSDHGIELELQVAAGGAAIVPAVMSGDLDVGYGASVSSAIANAKGLPIKIVAQGIVGAADPKDSINKLVVRGDSKIDSAKDLEGGKVAVNTLGSIAEIGIKSTLEEQGADLSKIQFVEIGLPDMPGALQAGRVEAIWATEPFLTQLESEGARSLYAWDVEFVPNASLASYFTSAKYIEEHQATLDRFLEAVNESLTYAEDHPEEVRAIIPKYLKMPAEAAEAMTLPIWDTDLHVETIEQQAQAAVTYGHVDEAPATADLVYEGA